MTASLIGFAAMVLMMAAKPIREAVMPCPPFFRPAGR